VFICVLLWLKMCRIMRPSAGPRLLTIRSGLLLSFLL
jgi:hypothetical protein